MIIKINTIKSILLRYATPIALITNHYFGEKIIFVRYLRKESNTREIRSGLEISKK